MVGKAKITVQVSTSAGVATARTIVLNQNPGYKITYYKII